MFSHGEDTLGINLSVSPSFLCWAISHSYLMSKCLQIWILLYPSIHIWHSVRMSLGFRPAELRNWKWTNGVGNSKMSIIWYISITNNVKTCKKFNESAQTAKFSVFTRGRQELCAENPKIKENVNYSNFSNSMTHPGFHHVKEHAQGFPNMYDTWG